MVEVVFCYLKGKVQCCIVFVGVQGFVEYCQDMGVDIEDYFIRVMQLLGIQFFGGKIECDWFISVVKVVWFL